MSSAIEAPSINEPSFDESIPPERRARTETNAQVWQRIITFSNWHPNFRMTTEVIQDIFEARRSLRTGVPQYAVPEPIAPGGTVFTAKETEGLLAFREKIALKTATIVAEQ